MASPLSRHRLLGAALAAAAVLAAGCAGVPSSGSPHAIEEHAGSQEADLDRPYVRLLPPAPQPGDPPQAIMDGFQVAMADFTDGHAAARRYLTRAAARTWDPDARTLVYANLQLTTAGTASATFDYQVTPLAVVSRDHAYSLDDLPESYDAKAVRRGGQWRLADVRPGTLLSSAEFERAFRGVDVYFPARHGAVLVPDRVFLPVPPGQLPTAMVRQLVAGPTSWLAPVVQPVAPKGTTVRSVTVDAAGTAHVSLGGQVADLDAAGRRRLLAALTWTLADQLPDVKAVALQGASGAVPVVATLQQFATYDPGAFPSGSHATYVDGGRVQQLTQGNEGPQPGAQPALDGAVDPVAPVAARGLAAVRRRVGGPDELVLYVAGHWRTIYRADALSSPTWSPDGSAVWVIATAHDGSQRVVAVELSATDDAATARPVAVAIDLAGSGLRKLGHLAELRMSRDGTRVALVRSRPGGGTAGARPYVALVDPTPSAPAISRLRPLAPACPSITGQRCLTATADVAWADADHVVVLANTTAGDPRTRAPYLVAVDGSSVQPVGTAGLSSDVLSISAAPGVPMVAVVPGRDRGEPEIFVQSSDSWVRVGSGYGVRYPD